MIRKYKSLPLWLHTLLLMLGLVLLGLLINFFHNEYSLVLEFLVLLFIFFEFFIGITYKTKRGAFEIDERVLPSRNFDEIKQSLINDHFTINRLNDDYYYVKNIKGFTVTIDLRLHFGIKKYQPKEENIIHPIKEAKKAINILLLPGRNKKTLYMAKHFGLVDKENIDICFIMDDGLHQLTKPDEFPPILQEIYDKYLK